MESKPAAKRNQKAGKKPGGRSGKEMSKKSHNSRGKSVLFYWMLFFTFRVLTYFFTTFQISAWLKICSIRDTRDPAADVTSVHDLCCVEMSSRVDKSQPNKEQHKMTHAADSFHTSSFSFLDPALRWKYVMKSLVLTITEMPSNNSITVNVPAAMSDQLAGFVCEQKVEKESFFFDKRQVFEAFSLLTSWYLKKYFFIFYLSSSKKQADNYYFLLLIWFSFYVCPKVLLLPASWHVNLFLSSVKNQLVMTLWVRI